MTPRRPLTPEEDRLWRQVMHDTEPLAPGAASQAGNHAPHPVSDRTSARPGAGRHGQPPAPKKTASQTPPVIRHRLPDGKNPQGPGVASGDLGNLDRKSRQRVIRGKVEVDAKIDLHGMRQSEAHRALIDRVLKARLDGARVLLVITGKGTAGGGPLHRPEPFRARGGGVLKAQVPGWLACEPLRSMIFSVQQAHRKHGGAGALYVFLKRVR